MSHDNVTPFRRARSRFARQAAAWASRRRGKVVLVHVLTIAGFLPTFPFAVDAASFICWPGLPSRRS